MFANEVTVAVPIGPEASKTSAVPTAMPSTARWSAARRPRRELSGRRHSARSMSVLMCSTPRVPQLVTMLVASAIEATAWKGEHSSPSTIGTAVCQVWWRPPFWWSPKSSDQGAALANHGTWCSPASGSRSAGGGAGRSSEADHTSPPAFCDGRRKVALARATTSPSCSTTASSSTRRGPPRTTRAEALVAIIRAGRKRSTW